MPKDMLIHYGVPGMRWGHRKARYDDPEGDRRKRREAKRDNPDEEPHDDYKRTVAKKSLKAMSTKEIQDMNTRIQAENLNRNLTMTRGERAKEWFKKTMIDVGKQSARRFIDHYANMGVDKLTGAIDSRFSSKKKGGSEAEPESAPEIPGLWGKKKKGANKSSEKKPLEGEQEFFQEIRKQKKNGDDRDEFKDISDYATVTDISKKASDPERQSLPEERLRLPAPKPKETYTVNEAIEGATKAIEKAKDITEKAESNNPLVRKAKQDVKDSVSNLRNIRPRSLGRSAKVAPLEYPYPKAGKGWFGSDEPYTSEEVLNALARIDYNDKVARLKKKKKK